MNSHLRRIARRKGLREGRVSAKLFGVKGDGRTNDRDALNRACKAIQAHGGGQLVLPHGGILMPADGYWVDGSQR